MMTTVMMMVMIMVVIVDMVVMDTVVEDMVVKVCQHLAFWLTLQPLSTVNPFNFSAIKFSAFKGSKINL